jgi:hypothetical protein
MPESAEEHTRGSGDNAPEQTGTLSGPECICEARRSRMIEGSQSLRCDQRQLRRSGTRERTGLLTVLVPKCSL